MLARFAFNQNESSSRKRLSLEKKTRNDTSMNTSVNTSQFKAKHPRFVLYGTKAIKSANNSMSQAPAHNTILNSKATLKDIGNILETAKPNPSLDNFDQKLQGVTSNISMNGLTIVPGRSTMKELDMIIMPKDSHVRTAMQTPAGRSQKSILFNNISSSNNLADKTSSNIEVLSIGMRSLASASPSASSKTRELKGHLAKMFINRPYADSQELNKKHRESSKGVSAAAAAIITVLGIAIPDMLSPEKRKQIVQSNDTSKEYIDLEALRAVPARYYLEKNSFKDMMGDSLGLMVKRNCADIKYESKANTDNRVEKMKETSFCDNKNLKFVRKYLKNKNRSGAVRKVYDLVNDVKYSIQLDDGYKKKIQEDEIKVQVQKLIEEKIAMEILAGKKEEVVSKLSPAKKLQQMIYDHRYVKFSVTLRS